MNGLLLTLALTISSVLACMPAHAQSLKQQNMIASDTQKAGELAREANQACGSSIEFRVDYPSYAHVLEDENNQSPWAYLANATDALKRVCRNDAGKQAVQAKIKVVTVSNGTSESESLQAGEFHYTVPYRGHGPATVVSWLEANL